MRNAISEEAARRRLINAGRAQLFGADAERVIAFVCECGNDDCGSGVLLTAREYAARTSDGELLLHERHVAA
jgi:hypothetical protein